MTRFTDKQLVHFRAKLETKRDDLLAREKLLEQGSVKRTTANFADERRAIEAALRRVHDHTYGICENCGSEIPFSRLEALFETRYCVDCERDLANSHRKNDERAPEFSGTK